MNDIEKKLIESGVLPIISLDDAEKAVNLGKALLDGGVKVCEVVFRSENAVEVLEKLTSTYPELTVGAGTVITTEQVVTAKKAGAKFIVSPGIDAEIVEASFANGLVPLPGVETASEVQLAVKLGVNIVKFFPAGLQGGTKAINAFAAPFPGIKYVPTNGVGMDNLEEFASNPHVAACGGIYPCPSDMIQQDRWTEITERCKESISRVKKARESWS